MKSALHLWIGIPIFNTLAQVFVKLAAEQAYGLDASGLAGIAQASISLWMLAAAAVEIACFFLWMQVLADVDLSKAFPLTAISYALIVLTSWLWFGEPVNLLQVAGSALILAGVFLVGAPERES